jgi:hypothetical protein
LQDVSGSVLYTPVKEDIVNRASKNLCMLTPSYKNLILHYIIVIVNQALIVTLTGVKEIRTSCFENVTKEERLASLHKTSKLQ